MEKKRDIKVFIEQLTKPRVEALFSELFDEYANKGIDKKQFAVKLLTGELEGIMDDYVDAFMGKTALTITDMDTNQLNSKVISKVKLTYFSVEDLSYFISDIVEAMESVSEEYSKLFAVLTAIGYNYQNKGFILPNLLYVDDITLNSSSENDIDAVIESIFAFAANTVPKIRTDRIMIACCPDNEAVRQIMNDRFFMSVGVSGLMLRIIDLQDIEHYDNFPHKVEK